MNPLVSIVIPVYNAEKYLQESLEDVINQSYANLEIICVDDGSTDDSVNILTAYQKKDTRIKIIHQANQYAGIARNNGFDASSGKYVMFLDADDFFNRSMVEKMVRQIEAQKAEVVVCGCEGYDNRVSKKIVLSIGNAIESQFLAEKEVISPKDIPNHIFQIKAGWAWDTMYSSEFIRNKKLRFQGIRSANDAYFTCLANAEADKIAIVNEILVTHRLNNPSSLWQSREPWWKCCYEMLDELLKALKERDLYDLYEKSFINWAADYIAREINQLSETGVFKELYTFYRDKSINQFHFTDYNKDFYYKKDTYELIIKLDKMDEIQFLISNIKALKKKIGRKKWRWPVDSFPDNAKLVVYGYGDIGKDYCEDIRRKNNYQLLMAVDRNWQRFENPNDKVCPVEQIKEVVFDYIIIAVLNSNIAEEIKNHLISLGVDDDKIIWFDLMGNTVYK